MGPRVQWRLLKRFEQEQMSNAPVPQRSDPVGDVYYSRVASADKVSDVLFYTGAVLSLAVLFVEKGVYPEGYRIVNGLFALAVLGLFVLGAVSRLYLTPRAEHRRRLDFFSSALGIKLTHETSVKYYNNAETDPIRRTAAQLLENLHFTKEITLMILRRERTRVAAYGVIWIGCLLWQQSDIGLVVAVSQAIFSEQILARYLRMEWLRATCERLYDETYQSFASHGDADAFRALTLNAVVAYEAAKAIAATPLSSKIFHRENVRLSAEWERIKQSLAL